MQSAMAPKLASQLSFRHRGKLARVDLVLAPTNEI